MVSIVQPGLQRERASGPGVKQVGEDGGAVESRPAEVVDRGIERDQCRRLEITDDAVITDRPAGLNHCPETPGTGSCHRPRRGWCR